ncbi:MAG: signal peptidase II [Bdellovibrionaceae bacterium]|nr:signal peptidase II [Pseudobdellovibrionaceae bacterium]
MRKRYLILFAFSFLIVAIDQLTKMYVHMSYQLGESTPIIPGLFNLTYVRNFGAAFGFLAQTHPAFREIFFLAMPPIALLIILIILRGVDDRDTWQVAALSSVFGGAIGNYIDRLRFRYVIDFLDFHWKEQYTWPAFNIADMAIVGGVIVLLILMFIEGRRESNKTPSAEAGS